MLGATPEEIQGFPLLVAEMDPPPHIVIVDYRLDHPILRTDFVRGTDLLQPIRDAGYAGKLVVKSANDSAADVAFFKRSGADASISKGLSIDSLLRELARVLGLESVPEAASDPILEVGVLDRHLLPLRARLLSLFRQGATESVEMAEAALDVGEVWAHVHRLKGRALAMGAKRLATACEAVRGLTREECAAALGEVRAAVDDTLASLPTA